ncbi:MAG: capsid cement protein [Caldilineaceae bacterium]
MAVASAIAHAKYSDGKAVDVTPIATVVKDQVAVIEGWMGITNQAAASGELIAMSLKGEYQFKVPTALAVVKGEIVRIDTTDLTGNTPDDTAYNKDAESSTNRNLFRATSDQNADDIVTGILMVGA